MANHILVTDKSCMNHLCAEHEYDHSSSTLGDFGIRAKYSRE